MHRTFEWIARSRGAADRLGARQRAWLAAVREDRGDVPGWVLITIMTAGLVTALWLVADTALQRIFTDALASVKGPSGP
ncbi:MAG: hypothetical protein ACYCXA_04000 [Actinomycetes bacterium]